MIQPMTARTKKQTAGLRVAVVAHALHCGGGQSVGWNLVDGLLREAPGSQFLVSAAAESGYEQLAAAVDNCQLVLCRQARSWRRLAFESRVLPRAVREFRPDVVLALGNRGLAHPGCPQAVLCQDAHYFYPTRHFGPLSRGDWLRKRYHAWHFRRSLRHTDLLLCQTPVARQRIRAALRFGGPIELCPNAVSSRCAPTAPAEPPAALARIGARHKLLCLTRYYSHKNLELLVELFRRHGAELHDVAVVLTIDRAQHPRARALLERIERLGLERQLVTVGALPQAGLGAYFGHVSGLILPTLLESFSATYIEAMHYRVPILTSDLDFARGICGDAALYFDPWRPESARDAVRTLRDDPDAARRLVAAGREQLRKVTRSWQEIARETLGQLERLASSVGTSAANSSAADLTRSRAA